MKRLSGAVLFLMAFTVLNAQTARDVAKEAAAKDSLDQSIAYLKKTVPALTAASDKRSGYIFLGSVQEQTGNYSEAIKSYVQAASIAAGDAAGMPKKSSEQLVIDAVRCALSSGDWATAQNYLNSAVRNSTDVTIVSYVKLYEQWSVLCRAQKIADTTEAVAMLKTYATLDSMKSVHPQLLLTLWHITGESSYSEMLKKNFAKSPEAAIVKGEIQTLPAPFWYFVPRSSTTSPEVEKAETQVSASATTVAVASGNEGKAQSEKKEKKQENKESESTESEKAVKQQLGLFRDKVNADALVAKLKEKGFTAKITSEVRPSGTTYYIVVVDENKTQTMGKELRTAGFDCYPVFE